MKKNWLILLTIIFAFTISGCADTHVKSESAPKAAVIDIESVSFHLTDELKDQMESKGLKDLALLTILCRS